MGLNVDGNQDFPDTDDDITTVSDDPSEIDESETVDLEVEETELDGDGTDDDGVDASADTGDGDDGDAADDKPDADTDTELVAEEPEKDEAAEGDVEPKPKRKRRKRFNPKEHTRTFQKRINREVRKREELKAENRALHERMSKLEQGQVEDKNAQEQQLTVTRISNAQAMHTQLMEDGEYKQASKVNSDITDMKLYQRDLEHEAELEKDVEETKAAQPEIPEVQMDWMRENKRFNRDVGYTAYVNEEFDKLLEDGYDPEDQELYDQLDTVIGRSKPKAKPARRPAAPPPNSGTAPAGASKVSRLTKDDLSRMEEWGLNPDNKEERKEWLANKSA